MKTDCDRVGNFLTTLIAAYTLELNEHYDSKKVQQATVRN